MINNEYNSYTPTSIIDITTSKLGANQIFINIIDLFKATYNLIKKQLTIRLWSHTVTTLRTPNQYTSEVIWTSHSHETID